MSNLLPRDEQRAIMKEYKTRRSIVAIAAFGATAFMCILFLLPAFILSQVKLNIVAEQADHMRSRGEIVGAGNESSAALLAANKKLTLLKEEGSRSVYDVITTVTSHKNNNIKIRTFSYIRNAETGGVRIGGLAKDRESLTQFLKALQAEAMFASVDLPVSSFAKDKDIDFAMNITEKK